MKVAIVLFALVAIAAADTYGRGYGRQHVDYSHVPYYNFDWSVQNAESYNDYAQTETRSGDETKTSWGVALPGKGSHIKRDDLVNAKHYVSHSYAAPDYKKY